MQRNSECDADVSGPHEPIGKRFKGGDDKKNHAVVDPPALLDERSVGWRRFKFTRTVDLGDQSPAALYHPLRDLVELFAENAITDGTIAILVTKRPGTYHLSPSQVRVSCYCQRLINITGTEPFHWTPSRNPTLSTSSWTVVKQSYPISTEYAQPPCVRLIRVKVNMLELHAGDDFLERSYLVLLATWGSLGRSLPRAATCMTLTMHAPFADLVRNVVAELGVTTHWNIMMGTKVEGKYGGEAAVCYPTECTQMFRMLYDAILSATASWKK
jgi:hypothetical protein